MEIRVVKTGKNAAEALRKIHENLGGSAFAKAIMKMGFYVSGEIVRAAPSWHGGLRRSFQKPSFSNEGTSFIAKILSDLRYARIQDEGGKILPSTKKFLAIPVSDKAKKNSIWPRNFTQPLVCIKSKAGNLLLIEQGKRGKFKVHYVLKPSVTLKGSQYLKRGVDASRKLIVKTLGEHVAIAISRGVA